MQPDIYIMPLSLTERIFFMSPFLSFNTALWPILHTANRGWPDFWLHFGICNVIHIFGIKWTKRQNANVGQLWYNSTQCIPILTSHFLFTDEAYHGQIVGHMQISPSLSERSVFVVVYSVFSVYSCLRSMTVDYSCTLVQTQLKHAATALLSAFAEFSYLITAWVNVIISSHVAVAAALCVA